jgi:hypothetical protein
MLIALLGYSYYSFVFGKKLNGAWCLFHAFPNMLPKHNAGKPCGIVAEWTREYCLFH